MKRKLFVALRVPLALMLAGCARALPTGTAEPVELTVFAAASLSDAFGVIKDDFEALHPHVTLIYNFAGSNALAQQLVEGAPADVFASANNTQMNVVVDAGRVVTGTPLTFARNRLVVIVPTGNPGGVATLQDLARPSVLLLLATAAVPVGQYSLDFLDKAAHDPAFGAAFRDGVLDNVVSYEENVRSVLTKVALGEGDAGIVYTSDLTGEAAGRVERLDIPDALNTVANYPIALVADSARAGMAQTFVDYLLSPDGQTALAAFGFIPVE